ncbi:MAG: hypothetical protein ACRYGA_07135 [Janthinobacterium lividum]
MKNQSIIHSPSYVAYNFATITLVALLTACGGSSNDGVTVPVGAPSAAALATGPGAVMPSISADTATAAAQMPSLSTTQQAGAALVPTPTPTPTPTSASASASALTLTPTLAPAPAPAPGPGPGPALTLLQQILNLERNGTIPKLDRSKDIAGPDANANGVRDDIESWINAQLVSERQRKSLMQDARATQRTLVVDLKDEAALQKTGEGFSASFKCGGDTFSDYSVFSRLAGKIEAMTANTKERAARYMQYNAARSGSSTTRPSGDACEP